MSISQKPTVFLLVYQLWSTYYLTLNNNNTVLIDLIVILTVIYRITWRHEHLAISGICISVWKLAILGERWHKFIHFVSKHTQNLPISRHSTLAVRSNIIHRGLTEDRFSQTWPTFHLVSHSLNAVRNLDNWFHQRPTTALKTQALLPTQLEHLTV